MDHNNLKEKNKKSRIEKIDILIFTIVFVIFGIALLSFFPGILTSDCVDQINQALTNKYSESHPIIHSFIIGNLTKIAGIWVPACFQIIVFSAIWTYICKNFRKYNNSKINQILQVIITIIVCVIPLNFLYAITLWKDILYSYAILLLLSLIYIGIKEKYNYSLIQIILISFSSVCIIKFRKNGVPIGCIMFCILLILNIVNVKSVKTAIKFIGIFIGILFIMTIPEICVNKLEMAKGGGVLNSTKVYCFGALLNQNIQLEEEEEKFLNTILNLEEWKNSYDPYNGTPILFSNNIDHTVLADKENEKRFNEIFMKYSKNHKRVIINHFLSVNSIWWSVKELGGMHSVVLSNSWVSEMSGGIYDNHPILQKGNEILTEITNKTFSDSLSYEIIYRPAFALYLSLIIILCICIKERKNRWKGYLLLSLPMILNTGTYILLISSQDQRYFYPTFLTEYFLILLFVNVFCNKSNIKRKSVKSEEKTLKKLLIIQENEKNKKDTEEKLKNIYSQQINDLDILITTTEEKQKVNLQNVTYLYWTDEKSKDGFMQLGYAYAKENDYDIVIELDEIQDIKYIGEMLEELRRGTDLVIGKKCGEKNKRNIISKIVKFVSDKEIDCTSKLRAGNKNIIYEFAENYYDNNYFVPCSNLDAAMKDYKINEIKIKEDKIKRNEGLLINLKTSILLLIRGINY